MAIGTVKWFNPDKGYGFIQPENGRKDVFVHAPPSSAGLSTLNEGAKISDEEAENRGKTSARPASIAPAAAQETSFLGQSKHSRRRPQCLMEA